MEEEPELKFPPPELIGSLPCITGPPGGMPLDIPRCSEVGPPLILLAMGLFMELLIDPFIGIELLFIELLPTIELVPKVLPIGPMLPLIMLPPIIGCELPPVPERPDRDDGVLLWDDFLTVSRTGPQAGQLASLHFL